MYGFITSALKNHHPFHITIKCKIMYENKTLSNSAYFALNLTFKWIVLKPSGFLLPDSHEVDGFDRSAIHLQVKLSEPSCQQVAKKSNLLAVIDLVRQALSLDTLCGI